jgi:glycosyltransferase involved in cell wall biosynthesis
MKVAFYAPLKPPDHPAPSGDRQLARALLQALRAGGHDATVASRFRTFDARGDADRQARMRALGERIARRLVERYRRMNAPPDAWFTYHLYHKAPDWLGPPVSRALGIPYVVAEASVAGKQRTGPWAIGYTGSIAAVEVADAIVFLNPVDVAGERNVPRATGVEEMLPAFLDLTAFTQRVAARRARTGQATGCVQLITVAMMRPGAKLASYRVLASALARVTPGTWNLVVVGDGPARAEVEAAFSGFDRERVRFAGAQSADRVAALLGESDLFVWPAIDEAFGMALIEAQACGLPVVAGNAGGVSAVVAAGRTGVLVPVADPDAFAMATERMLRDAALRERMGREAIAYVRARHDLPVAASRIDRLLRRVTAARAQMAAP